MTPPKREAATETRHIKLTKGALRKIAKLQEKLKKERGEDYDFRPVSIGTVIEYALGRCVERVGE